MTHIIITGPSASGKGRVAFELAQRLGAEIVSVDSMKIYRELDVVTAKPDAARRSACRYHLIDVVDPDRDFSVGDYLPLLEGTLVDAARRGRPVLLAGGTALYLKGFLHGLLEGPGAHWEIRERLLSEARDRGLGDLFRRLETVDPKAAAKILPEDERRIVRALEFHEATGSPISRAWEWTRRERRHDARLFGIGWSRAELYQRADRRVLDMRARGLLEEVRGLLARKPLLSRTARQCIGIKEVGEALLSGESEAATIERIQRSTRNFIKRQMTWFRKMEIEWLPASGWLDPAAMAGEVIRRLGDPPSAGSHSL